jgi:DNA-binding NarL/FixJ family response regulator
MLHWLHHELGPLLGRQLAWSHEPSAATLAPRLRETLDRLLRGDGEKQIAARLHLSRATVHEYVTAIYRHFGAHSRSELLARWLRYR